MSFNGIDNKLKRIINRSYKLKNEKKNSKFTIINYDSEKKMGLKYNTINLNYLKIVK